MFSKLGKAISNIFKFARNIAYIVLIFVATLFVVGVFMPDNLQKVLETLWKFLS